MTGTLFEDPDLQALLDLYHAASTANPPRRLPWTWATLTISEQAVLTRLIDGFITSYNHIYATTEDDLVPPCWPEHPALAYELAAHTWLWYAVHHDPTATAEMVGDYYLRHLPGFQRRLNHLLGRSPTECRTGQHPTTWRKEVNVAIRTFPSNRRLARLVPTGIRLYFGFKQ